MEDQKLPEYKAVIKHRGNLAKNIKANFPSIISKLREKELITQGQYDSFSESKDAAKVVDDCILLSIEMAGIHSETRSAISAYYEFMDVLQSCANQFFKDLIGDVEAERKKLYRSLFPTAVEPGVDASQQYQVFISYGREEKTKVAVDSIRDCLEERGLKVFVHRSSLRPGDHWPTKLVSAIHTSPVFIAVLTKKYVSSHYCHGELYEAQALGKSLFPVVLEDGWDTVIAGKPIKEVVDQFQYTFSGKDIKCNLDTLVQSIAALLGGNQIVTDHSPTLIEVTPETSTATSDGGQLLPLASSKADNITTLRERMASQKANLQNFDELISQLSTVLQGPVEISDEVSKVANSVLDQLTKLNYTGTKLHEKGVRACNDVLELITAASHYIEQVDAFVFYGKKAESASVIDGVRQRNYKPLLQVMEQLRRSLTRVGESYQNFNEICTRASQSTADAAEECAMLKNKAKLYGNVTRVAGGTITTALGMASVLTGGVTSIVAGGVAVGTGIGTYHSAEQYGEAERLFGSIGATLKNLEKMIIHIRSDIERINLSVESSASILDDLERQQKEKQEQASRLREQNSGLKLFTKLFTDNPDKLGALSLEDDQVFCWSVERFFNKLDEGHKQLQSTQKSLKARTQKVMAMMNQFI